MLTPASPPSSNRSGGSSFLIGVIILRIGAGLTLLYLHGWHLAIAVWQHLWNQAPWDVITTVEEAALPFPQTMAVAAAIITALTAISWILGFVTRLSSAIFLPVTVTALLVANRNGESYAAELCILYFFISLTLLIHGSGLLGLDSLFKKRRARTRW